MATKKAELRLLLAEDHAWVANAFQQMLAEHHIRVVAVAHASDTIVGLYVAHRPDVVLLDVNMPPATDSLDVVNLLLRQDPEAKVVAMSGDMSSATVGRALTAGCVGFISKTCDPTEVPNILQAAVTSGEVVLDRKTATAMFVTHHRREGQAADRNLTARELEVLRLVADGHSNDEIAQKLHIARSTVANTVTRMFEKLGVSDRTAAAVTALRSGLID